MDQYLSAPAPPNRAWKSPLSAGNSDNLATSANVPERWICAVSTGTGVQMIQGKKHAILALMASVLPFIAMMASAAEPSLATDSRWGIYASLAGKQGKFTDGHKQFREEYTWTVPGKTLLLTREEVTTGKESYRAEITLSDAVGKLHAEYRGRFFFGPREIQLRDDGSALWIRGKLTEPAVLVETVADGGWTEKVVRVDSEGHIERVRTELKRDFTGSATPAMIPSDTDSLAEGGMSNRQNGLTAKVAPATVSTSPASLVPPASITATSTTAPQTQTHAQARSTPASTDDGRPLAQDEKLKAFGPLSYFADQILYDEQEEDLIGTAKVDDGIGIASPDGSPKDLTVRAVAKTSLTGRPTLVRFSYGVEGFVEKGTILADGSIRFRWHSMLLGATLEDTFGLAADGCLKWTVISQTRDSDNTTTRTFCRMTDEAQILAAAQKHVARNLRNGTDSASIERSVRELQAKDAEEERRKAANKAQQGSSWVGTLIGAAAGVAAAKSYGGDGAEMAKGALMGAAVTSPANDVLAHGMNVFNDEMASKDAEQEAEQTRIEQIQEQAQASERERMEVARQAQQMHETQQQSAQNQPATPQQKVARDGEPKLRDAQAAERQRLATEQQRLADEQEKSKQQDLQQSLQNLRDSFQGAAVTCPGGGKDVLYLKTSVPPKTRCNSVRASFEARCPGTPSGTGVHFSQSNYIGASCLSGDTIQIGTMNCPAEQVRITLSDASCG